MNEMQVFQNSEFGELGVLEIEGKPYFPAKAAAKILGYKDTTNAIKQHCNGVVKHHLPTDKGEARAVTIPDLAFNIVDKVLHATFTLAFRDSIEEPEAPPLMAELESNIRTNRKE